MRDKNSRGAFCSGILCTIRRKILAAFLFHGIGISKGENTYMPFSKKKKKKIRQ